MCVIVHHIMKFSKIYEDEHCLIIDKPVGVMVHPDGRSKEETISDILKKEYKEVEDVGDEDREGIVHRLDKDTSGVLMLAKDQATFLYFKRLFKEHKVRKVYRAIVEGNIREDTGMITAPIARARSDFRKRTTVDMFSKDSRGTEREAQTRYKVIGRTTHDGKKYTYVECFPITGRTHQIRVHFRSIRHPIIGDELYGSSEGSKEAVRSMLHAYSVTTFLPEKGETTFIAPIPDDMKETLASLGFLC